MSEGGLLLDAYGDLAVTADITSDSTVDLVNTRLKAALNGWQLYAIGADLQSRIGQLADPEIEIRIQRQVVQSLSDILPRGSYEVQTLLLDDGVTVLVYLNGQLINTQIVPASLNNNTNASPSA